MSKSQVCLLILSCFLLFPSFVLAERGKRGGFSKFLSTLDLKDSQKMKIKDIHRSYKDKIKLQHESAQKARESFTSGIADSSISEQRLQFLHEKVIASKMLEMRTRFDKMIKIRAILDDQQKIDFMKKMEERHARKRFKR